MKLVIIAGEESGDYLGASLVDSLKKIYNTEIDLYGIGGKELKKHDIKNFFDISDINVMGLVEVIPKILKIKNIIRKTVIKIRDLNPDIVITIDSPDFNLRIATALKKENRNIKIVHYVAPSVWNWRPGRINTVAKAVDHLLTILPFEKEIFDREKIQTTFVGHRITDTDLSIYNDVKATDIDKDIKKPIFLILPGSRRSEVKRLLPIFLDSLEICSFKDQFDFILPTTDSMIQLVKEIIIKSSTKLKVKIINDEHKKFQCFYLADYGLIASGTVGLELSYFDVTYLSTYKLNPISYFLLHFLVKSKLANLINVILGKMVIPELLQANCNVANINKELDKLINDEKYRIEVKSQVNKAIKALFAGRSPSIIAAETILNIVNR